jgi:predicted RND superfamily exporter protein
MDKAIFKDLFNRFWKYVIIIILAIIVYFLFNQTKQLELKVNDAVSKAKEHEIKAKFYKNIYLDLLTKDNVLKVKYDSLETVKNKIKIQTNEKIIKINAYTVSDMQYFFNERTK